MIVIGKIITFLSWWAMFMGLAVNLRIKPPHARILVLQSKSEFMATEHGSLAEQCYDIIIQLTSSKKWEYFQRRVHIRDWTRRCMYPKAPRCTNFIRIWSPMRVIKLNINEDRAISKKWGSRHRLLGNYTWSMHTEGLTLIKNLCLSPSGHENFVKRHWTPRTRSTL